MRVLVYALERTLITPNTLMTISAAVSFHAYVALRGVGVAND